MPITADQERRLLNHYGLSSLYPDSWPRPSGDDNEEEDDESDDDIDGGKPDGALDGRPRTATSARGGATSGSGGHASKYRHIDRHASVRSTSSMGPDSVVQRDEPDALGMVPSVAAELRRRGLPADDDLRLRNRFMLSSTTFSPALYLSQVHQDASTNDLLRGLDFLSRSIEQKSASLKVLVESNFDKFVRAKATIDTVYTEMRTHGADDVEAPGRRPHSRHTSRGQTHFRNTSGPFSPAVPSAKKHNALTKESEYGVLGIKAPLQDVAIRVEEVWGPALGGREKEETLKQVLQAVEQHREIFALPGTVREAVRKNDYDTVVASWRSAQKYAEQASSIADAARVSGAPLTNPDAQQILITAKMWHDVSAQVEPFKRDLWRRLKSAPGRRPVAVTDEADREEHMELIGVLLQLGVDENPIWQWLNSRHLYLRDRIARSFERGRIETEILRRRLAGNDQQDARELSRYLRAASDSASRLKRRDAVKTSDTPAVIAFWENVVTSLTHLLGAPNGVLGEVLEFWETTQSFIDGTAQKSFPMAVFAAGLEHLELEPDDVANLRSGAMELVDLIRESVMAFFNDPPVEDLSDLYSPIPPTPITPDSAGGSLTPSSRRTFAFDAANVPPPSPKRGDAWEKFAFWPPYANALSGSHYLAKLLTLVGTAASEMASLSLVKPARAFVESLKTLVSAARERCVAALIAAWITDAGERCKYLETWQRSPERRDLTTMAGAFVAYEETVLANFQKVAYISEAAVTAGSVEIIIPPPAKLLQGVRTAFVTSLYKTLSGMVENAEKMKGAGRKEEDPDGVTLPQRGGIGGVESAVDSSIKNVRTLMTLSNLTYLRSDAMPVLVNQFESCFSVKLTEESKTIRDVLSQIDAREFQSYVQPIVEQLSRTILQGISRADWAPPPGAQPHDIRPYIYEVLLILVLVHSETSTTAAGLTNQILSYLLEQASAALLTSFRSRQPNHYSLSALMQATLDVEFLAQTLNNYTTDKAGETQSQIYLALDERTDEDSRRRLQAELPEMRGVLKRLREGTKGEFGCFRRERRGRTTTATGR